MTNRLSYKLSDVNSIAPGEFVPHEILLDYNTNELVITDAEGITSFKLFDYISNVTEDFLNSKHMTDANQHILATLDNNGFMSSEDKLFLSRAISMITDLNSSKTNTIDYDKVKVHDISYEIHDTNISINCSILTKGIRIIPESIELPIYQRPDTTSLNMYNKSGYRDDLIVLKIVNGTYIYNTYSNVDINDNRILIGDIVYNYNKNTHCYDGEDELSIIPLYKIRRRNDNPISETNILGKLSDNYISNKEIIDISRHELPKYTLQKLIVDNINNINDKKTNGKKYTRLIKTNIKRNLAIDSDTLLYLPLNKNDIDVVTGQSLGGEITYKHSPFGYMMRGSLHQNNLLSFNDIDSFVLDFLIDSGTLTISDILDIKDIQLNDIIKISGTDDAIIIKVDEITKSIKMDKENKYHFITLKKLTNNIVIFIDGIYTDTIVLEYNKLAHFLNVNVTTVAIGEILVTKNTDYINTELNENTYLVDNVTTDNASDVFVEHEELFDYQNTHTDNIDAVFDLASINTISAGDSLYVYFNNEILDTLYENAEDISYVSGNMVTLNDTSLFEIGDLVKIFKGINNISEIYTIINKDGNALYLNKIIPSTFIGFNIAIAEHSRPIVLTVNDTPLNSIITDGYFIRIIFDKTYDIGSQFKIKFIEKIPHDHILSNIDAIHSVSFDDISAEELPNNMLTILSKNNLDIIYNTNIISSEDKQRPMFFIDDNISFTAKTKLNDFLGLPIKKNEVTEILKVKARITLSGGVNDIVINGHTFNTEGNVVNYIIPDLEMDEDSNIILNITTETQNKKGKLYIGDVIFFIEMAGDKVFSVRNQNNIITDFLVISNNMLYAHSTGTIKIFIDEKSDSYTTDTTDYKQITEVIDNYVLVLDSNDIVQLKHLSDNRIYTLSNYYIL